MPYEVEKIVEVPVPKRVVRNIDVPMLRNVDVKCDLRNQIPKRVDIEKPIKVTINAENRLYRDVIVQNNNNVLVDKDDWRDIIIETPKYIPEVIQFDLKTTTER